MGEKNKLENKILGILKKLQKMTASEMMRFDVRDYEFRRVVADALAELEADFEEYKNPSNNIVVKTAIGKKWAQVGMLDFDYDASLFANCVYLLAMFPNKAPSSMGPNSKNAKNEYKFTFDGENYYRGDTMNSWATTLNAFFGVRSNQKFLVPGFFEAHLLPEYITNFMTIVYTIGNFFPLPKALNIPRGSRARSKDYWDLALLERIDPRDEATLYVLGNMIDRGRMAARSRWTGWRVPTCSPSCQPRVYRHHISAMAAAGGHPARTSRNWTRPRSPRWASG